MYVHPFVCVRNQVEIPPHSIPHSESENISHFVIIMLLFLRSVDKYYLEGSLDMDQEHEDPWSGDYSGLSVPVFKLVLRSKLPLIHEKTKVHMLRNWVATNSFLSNQAAVFEMLRCLDLKELTSSMKEVTALVREINRVMNDCKHK